MKKIFLAVLIVVLVGTFVIYLVINKRAPTPDNTSTTASTTTPQTHDNLSVEEYFYDRITNLAVEDVGQPIEGFDHTLLILAFPGLIEADFNNVKTFEGKLQYTGGKLVFTRTVKEPITSAEKTISKEGYATLLKNVSERLGLPMANFSQVDKILIAINTSDRLTLKIDQGGIFAGVKIIPTQVVEDSRCPVDVTCIQAGTVRVAASVDGIPGVSAYVFELGVPVSLGNKRILLEEVLPAPHMGKTINPIDYSFYFQVSEI